MSKVDSGIVKKEKELARKKLNAYPRFSLERDLFLVHGWGDEDNVCWTTPYTEQGAACSKGWVYTFKQLAEEKIVNHKERVHYVRLVKDETKAKTIRDKKGNVIKVTLGKDGKYDGTYYFVSFFQFAELLKDKISDKRKTDKIDIVCHSMGGLDAVTAIGVDPADDTTDFIEKPTLDGIHNLITVATPHRGFPGANLANTKIAKFILGSSEYIAQQGANMSPKSQFIQTVNTVKVRERVLDRIDSLHVFGGGSDIVVPAPYFKFNKKDIKETVINKKVVEHEPCTMAAHSQAMGITQDPRLLFALTEILRT